MTDQTPSALLDAGRALIASTLEPHGFGWMPGPSGEGSGGAFASGSFVRGDRRLELHFRFSLGLVTYHIAESALSHADYMRHTGHKADARYPGVSSNPLDAFRDLAYDLVHFSGDFISGPGDTFAAACLAAKRRAEVPGFKRLGAT